MAYFNFKRLIGKYSREFTVTVKGEKTLNAAGDYVYGTPQQYTLRGAIIGYAENKIHRSEGQLTQQDMALHMTEPINEVLIGTTVIFDGNTYRIEAQKGKGNADFTGVFSYTLKYVSAFNEKEGGND